MFSSVVLEYRRRAFRPPARRREGASSASKTRPQLTAADWKASDRPQYQDDREREATGASFRKTCTSSSICAIGAVFDSWNSKRAIDYRALQQDVRRLGHRGQRRVDGVRQHGRRLGNGRRVHARSEHRRARALRRVSAQRAGRGRRGRHSHAREDRRSGRTRSPTSTRSSSRSPKQLEAHYRDMQDLEFTVERGKLYMLQTRSGKRSAEAAVKIALDFVRDGLIDESAGDRDASTPPPARPAVLRAHRSRPRVRRSLGKGLNASPGAAAGQIVFDADDAADWGKRGQSRDPRAHRDRRPTTCTA